MITHGTMDSFQNRLNKIQSGGTTAWTEPGGGLADAREGAKLTAAIARKFAKKKQTSGSLVIWVLLIGVGGYFGYTHYGDQLIEIARATLEQQLAT